MSNSSSTPYELKDGQKLTDLHPSIRSLNGRYFAMIRPDGNFVLHDEVKKMDLRSSGTSGQGTRPYRVELHDGNLVLYDSRDAKLWSTNTENEGQQPHRLEIMEINDHGNLCIKDAKDRVIWIWLGCDDSNCWREGTIVSVNCPITSPDSNHTYTANVVQNISDSTKINVVLYLTSNKNVPRVVGTAQTGTKLKVTSSGVYAVNDQGNNGNAIWSTTNTGSSPYAVVLNTNGSLTLDGGCTFTTSGAYTTASGSVIGTIA